MTIAASEQAGDPWIGQVLAERYRIDARLGDGGMGTVYRGHHLALDRPVAVKLLHARLTRDASVAKRFDREALAASKLDHPNCVRMLDAGSADNGTKYLVMELLEGRELHTPGEGPVPLARAAALVVQILRALEHAHRRGLVHRDLKPENVFIVRDDDGGELVKLVDFGIVKLLGGDANAEALTRAGLVFGTPRYMSPEQVAGGKIDERADLYAVGVILHQLLAGTPPFDADEPGILLRMHLVADPPTLPDDVPAPVRDVVAKLLAKSPKDRPASAREARELLEAALVVTPDARAGAFAASSDASLRTAAAPLPPSGVWKTVIAAPAPVAAPPRRRESNTAGLVVAFVIMAIVIGWAILRVRACASSPPADVPAAPTIAPPPVAPVEPVPPPAAAGTDTQALAEDEEEPEEQKPEKHGKGGGRGKHKKKKKHD